MRLADLFRPTTARTDPDPLGIDTWPLGYTAMQSWSPSTNREYPAYSYASFGQIGYQGNPVVFALEAARMRLFAEARFKWRNKTTKALFGNTDLALLETPWANGQTPDLLVKMLIHADFGGNAYVANYGERLECLRPDFVTIVLTEKTNADGWPYREVEGYDYNDYSSGEHIFFPVEDVAHWAPYPDPIFPHRGMSWITPIVREINSDTGMTEHKQRFLENAATPNMIVKYPATVKLNQDTLTRLEQAMAAKYGGSSNAYKSMILDQGGDGVVVGNSFDKMMFPQVMAAGEARIASAAGVPPIVAGLQAGLDASTYSNYRQAWRVFADGTGHSLWRSACAALAAIIPTPPGAELWFDVSDIPAMADTEMDKQLANAQFATALNTLIAAGFNPDSAVSALESGDMTLLVHSGLLSVQLQKPGDTQPAPVGETATPDPQEGTK